MVRLSTCLLAVVLVSNPGCLRAQTLVTGDTLHLRLFDRLASGRRAPHGVRALVIAPVRSADGRVTIPPGSVVTARVTGSGMERYEGKRHWTELRLDSIAIPLGNASGDTIRVAIAARVLSVDDSRESMDSAGRIAGPPIPSIVRSKRDWAVLILGFFHPVGAVVLAATLEGERAERHRAIVLPVGTELTTVIMRNVPLGAWTDWAPPPPIASGDVNPDSIVASSPMQAMLAGANVRSDVINIAVVGSAAQMSAAFAKAGWTVAVPLDLRSDFVTLIDAARGKGYDAQPVSKLLLGGRAPDHVYEKVTDTFAKRHHFRIWRWPIATSGYVSDTARAVWLIAATHDVGLMFSGQRKTFTHRVDPNIDDERDKVVSDLVAANAVEAMSYGKRAAPDVIATVNGTRIPTVTDWRMAVLVLRRPR